MVTKVTKSFQVGHYRRYVRFTGGEKCLLQEVEFDRKETILIVDIKIEGK